MTEQETLHSQETADVVIIGGGVIGLSVARALVLRGVGGVTLIERASLGAEASYAAGGILAPQAEADCVDEFFNLASTSRDMYPGFAAALREETGIDVELDLTGTLYLAFTDRDEVELDKRYRWQTGARLPIERMSAEEARRLEPCIADNVRTALRFPRDIQVDNRRLLRALIAANTHYGVRIIKGVNVDSIRIDRGRVAGVETADVFFSTNRVVVAAGAWTAFITSNREMPRVPIEPIRGQMISLASDPRLAQHVIYSPRGYIVPRLDGRLLAGTTTEHAGFDKSVTALGMHAILSQALEISPAVAGLALVDNWAGLRPRAEDNLPVLGPCAEIEGLFYATGHYRNGILLAPITGELIAEAIAETSASSLLGAFAPERFELMAVN